MKFHILNGDALAEQLDRTKITGKRIVFRECLIEGNVQAPDQITFWDKRATFISKCYSISKNEYMQKTKVEFEQLLEVPENSTIYLWFERDLFCQANLWFVVHYLYQLIKERNLYPFLVLPTHERWTGFGEMDEAELNKAYDLKLVLYAKDLKFFADMWSAYRDHQLEEMKQLAYLNSTRYSYITDVVDAHIARYPDNGEPGKPYQLTKQIIEELESQKFGEVFQEFCRRAGIYGFGDLQFRKIFNQVLQEMP